MHQCVTFYHMNGFGKNAPSRRLIGIALAAARIQDGWIDRWLFKWRRLICSGIINHRHESYICQKKSFWLQIQCTIEKLRTERKSNALKNESFFEQREKELFDFWKLYIYQFIYISYKTWDSKNPSTFTLELLSRQVWLWWQEQGPTNVLRAASLSATNLNKASASSVEYLSRSNSPTCSWSTSLDLLQSEQETPVEGKEETSLPFFCRAPRWDQIFWMLHKSNNLFMKGSGFFTCGDVKRQDILPKQEVALSGGNG